MTARAKAKVTPIKPPADSDVYQAIAELKAALARPAAAPPAKILLSVEEAADVLSIGRYAVLGYIAKGWISTVQHGTRQLVVVAELPAFIERLRAK